MAIDRKKIIAEMSKVNILGDEEGIITGFKVCVNVLPTCFWTGFAERLMNKADDNQKEPMEWLLVNAGHECGYHTCHGILSSDEWNQVITPMVEKIPEDLLEGAFAVLTAWGWAQAEIITLIPGEKLVVRAYDYYEADAIKYGIKTTPCAYMLRGISAALMDLAYGGPYDKTGNTGLRTFDCVQVKGIECGDDYGEFVVTRSKTQ